MSSRVLCEHSNKRLGGSLYKLLHSIRMKILPEETDAEGESGQRLITKMGKLVNWVEWHLRVNVKLIIGLEQPDQGGLNIGVPFRQGLCVLCVTKAVV